MSSARCHVCGRGLDRLWATATDTEYGATAQKFAYFLCEDCDCLSIDPLPEDRLREIYPPSYYSFASAGEPGAGPVARVKAALDARSLRRALALTAGAEAPRILDVGGGRGEMAAHFVELAGSRARAVVVDLDEPSVEAARRRGLEGFAGRFEDFDTDERFDLITMLNLVEHVADPLAVLRRAADLLAPGGLLWLQTPNFHSLDARLFRARNWAGLHCPRHWVVFGDRGLEAALANAGLDPVELRRTQAGAFWAASLLGLRRIRRPPGPGARPLVRYRSFMPLAAAGAAFDFATLAFRRTSQLTAFARAGRSR